MPPASSTGSCQSVTTSPRSAANKSTVPPYGSMPPRMSIRAGRPSERTSASAATACVQRLSGLKRPILNARHGVPAAALIAFAADMSTGASAPSGIPLGMTTGLTLNGHIRCFMYLLTVVIAATKSRIGQSIASNPKRVVGVPEQHRALAQVRCAKELLWLSALQNQAVCHSSQSTATVRPALGCRPDDDVDQLPSGSVAVRSRIFASSHLERRCCGSGR